MLKTAKVVGLNSDTDAALALSLPGGDVGLFVIVSCSLEDAFSRTRQALSEAEDAYRASAQPVSQRLSEVIEAIQKSLPEAENLEILAAVVQYDPAGSVLYLQNLGQALLAYLLRGESKSDLCGMAEGHLVSGILKPGDRVVLSTTSLVEILGGDIAVFGHFPIDNLEDEVAAHLPEAESYPVAALIIEEDAAKPESGEITEVFTQDSAPVPRRSINFGLIKILPRSKKGIAILGVILAVLVLGGILLSNKQRQESAVLAGFEQSYKKAVDEFDKARLAKDSDPVAAAASLVLAKADLAEALKIKPQNSRALDLKKQIEDQSGGILRIYQAENFPLWLDLDLIKKGLRAEKLSLSHGNLLILDGKLGVLVSVTLDNKSQQTLAGQDKLGEARLASLNGDNAFVYSADKGVVRVDIKSKQVKEAVKNDEDWGGIAEIYGFAGNIYLLDDGNPSTGSGQIWKYVPVAAGYSDKQEYFKEETRVNLAGARRLQIDSSVWVLKAGGEILKFTQGSPDFFSLSGLDKPINPSADGPKSFFVSGDTDNLYLLDSGNSRLLVLDKKGNYLSQYRSDKLGSFSDLVVDEKGKKAYLLDGSKIFVMELK